LRSRYCSCGKLQPTCPSDIRRRLLEQGGRAESLGGAFQWNLAARAASKRSNCKGPPGLPCAVTPQGTWPPYIPSNPSTMITILRTSVCPVVNNHRVGQKRTSGRHVLARQLRCGLKIGPRLVAHKINISALIRAGYQSWSALRAACLQHLLLAVLVPILLLQGASIHEQTFRVKSLR
jgi:hypothetical protein